MAYFPTLLDLLLAAVASTWSLLNLMLFIVLIGLSFAITGRYTFKADMDALTRSNFGSFSSACLTTFQVLRCEPAVGGPRGALSAAMARLRCIARGPMSRCRYIRVSF